MKRRSPLHRSSGGFLLGSLAQSLFSTWCPKVTKDRTPVQRMASFMWFSQSSLFSHSRRMPQEMLVPVRILTSLAEKQSWSWGRWGFFVGVVRRGPVDSGLLLGIRVGGDKESSLLSRKGLWPLLRSPEAMTTVRWWDFWFWGLGKGGFFCKCVWCD